MKVPQQKLIVQNSLWSLAPIPQVIQVGQLSPGEGGCAVSCQSCNLWYGSAPCTYSFGLENTNHCVHQKLLLLKDCFSVHQLYIGPQQKSALNVLPAFWEPCQDDVHVC